MKRAYTCCMAALAGCTLAAAAVSASPVTPPDYSAPGRSQAARASGGKPLMAPEELAVLKQQIRLASPPAKGEPPGGRGR